MSKGPFYIPSLDGLRAISFLIVFLAHAGLPKIPGGFGVTVFFFLSGFLITTLMRMEAVETGTVSLSQFYIRRVFRILPPFYVVLTLAVILTVAGLLPGELSLGAVLSQALHFANYWIIENGHDGQAAGTGVYWSLAVEEHFYLGFPVIYLAVRKFIASARAQALTLWTICGAVLLWRCVLVFVMHAIDDRTYMATDTRLDSILIGCGLAVWGNPVLDKDAFQSDTLWKWILLPLGLLGLVATFLIQAPWFRETLRYSIQGISLIPIFVTAIRFHEWAPMRILNHRALAYIGVLSYPLYLVHHIVLYGVRFWWTASLFAQGALTLAISFALSWGIHKGIEKPFAKLRKRFTPHAKAR